MARKPTKPPVEESSIDSELMDAISETQNSAASLSSSYSDDRDTLNQLMGQVQMGQALAKFANVASLAKLAHIKESKMYRALQGKKLLDREGNEIADVSTWEGFCLAIGTTRQKVDEDLRNLKAFGEEALSDLSRVGAGYRELRQYRRLPEDSKQALLEAAKTGDRDQFIDLAEEIMHKHTEERTKWQNKEEEYIADLEAKEAVAETNRQRIDELQEKVQRIKKIPPDEAAAEMRTQISELADAVETDIRIQLKTALGELAGYAAVHPQLEQQISDYISTRLDLLDKALLHLRAEVGFERTAPLTSQPEWDDA